MHVSHDTFALELRVMVLPLGLSRRKWRFATRVAHFSSSVLNVPRSAETRAGCVVSTCSARPWYSCRICSLIQTNTWGTRNRMSTSQGKMPIELKFSITPRRWGIHYIERVRLYFFLFHTLFTPNWKLFFFFGNCFCVPQNLDIFHSRVLFF